LSPVTSHGYLSRSSSTSNGVSKLISRLKALRRLGIDQRLTRANIGFGLAHCLQLVIYPWYRGELGEPTPVPAKQSESRRVWFGIAVEQLVQGNNPPTPGARYLHDIVGRCMREKSDSCPRLDETHRRLETPRKPSLGVLHAILCMCLALLADLAEHSASFRRPRDEGLRKSQHHANIMLFCPVMQHFDYFRRLQKPARHEDPGGTSVWYPPRPAASGQLASFQLAPS
jgi:hypothetical protein